MCFRYRNFLPKTIPMPEATAPVATILPIVNASFLGNLNLRFFLSLAPTVLLKVLSKYLIN